jgi:hypothetical protein
LFVFDLFSNYWLVIDAADFVDSMYSSYTIYLFVSWYAVVVAMCMNIYVACRFYNIVKYSVPNDTSAMLLSNDVHNYPIQQQSGVYLTQPSYSQQQYIPPQQPTFYQQQPQTSAF